MSKKLMPREKARRTDEMASSSEMAPKTFPSGDAPNPTQLSLRPVSPRSRDSSFGFAEAIASSSSSSSS